MVKIEKTTRKYDCLISDCFLENKSFKEDVIIKAHFESAFNFLMSVNE